MSLLTVVQHVARRAGIPVPSIVIGSTDDQVRQLLGLYEALGTELAAGEYVWQFQKRTTTWTSTGVEDQGLLSARTGDGAIGFVNETFWNLTNDLPIYGPTSDQDWALLSVSSSIGPFYNFYIAQNHLYIRPAVPATDTLSWAWTTENWITNAAGTVFKSAFTADDDVSLFPESTMRVGLQAWWARQKGLPYADLMASFDNMIETNKMKETPKKILRLDGPGRQMRPGILVPPGNWPL